MAKKNRSLRVAVWIILIAAVLVAVFLFLRRRESQQGEKYRSVVLDRGDITETVTATGTISAVTTVQVGSQVSGIISHLYADFNSPVKKGQLLAELDPTPFRATVEQRKAALDQAEVQLRNAEITFKRQQRLLAEKLIAEADYDSAKAARDAASAVVAQARGALTQAETNLQYTKIRSPVDGVVVDRQYDAGQTVAASFQAPTLFTIAQDLTKMQVLADVDQSDIGRVHDGETALFTVDAYPEQKFKGKVAQVRLNATVNQNVVTYPVIIEVANPDLKLRPKMTADVTLQVATVKDVLRIPNAALRFRPPESPTGAAPASTLPTTSQETEPRRMGQQAQGPRTKNALRAYLLGPREELEPEWIEPGITDGRYTQQLEGPFKTGDRVVIGQATVRAGAPGFGGGRHF
ncbi:MAG TPA: efflux RND transporter periplasmic adaptor subunit [Thermoanaerobaculia bacterium]|nr:efflux RND transporter periplasmic adaptor subunit [Thermoanaerobaculia bacterium]